MESIVLTTPFRVLEESTSSSESSGSDPTNAVIFVGISLLLGIACRHVLRGTRVPYSVALLVLGIGIGSLGSFFLFIFDCVFIYLFLYFHFLNDHQYSGDHMIEN